MSTTSAPPRPAPAPIAGAPARDAGRPRTVRVRNARPRLVVDGVALAALVLGALTPLLPVYGRPFWPAAVGGVVLGGAVAVLSARLRWGLAVTAACAVAVHLLAGGPLAAPTTTTAAGFLPSLETLRLLLAGTVTVWKDVLTLEPTLGAGGGLLLAPYLLGFVGTAVAVSVALRTSALAAPATSARPRRRPVAGWAAAVPVVVLVVSLLLGTKESVAPLLVGSAAVVVALVWSAGRRGTLAARRVPALALMVLVTVYGGVVAGPQLAVNNPRLVLRDEVVPPFDPRDHPSPLSSFRRFVKDWEDEPLLTVRGLPAGVPVRLATMDAYDGVVWNVAGSSGSEGSGQFRRVGETTGVTARGERHEVGFEVHALPMVWLPTVGWTDRFTLPTDVAPQLRYNDATGTAVLVRGVRPGTRWTTEVVVPRDVDDEALDGAPAADVVLPEPTGVPDAVPLYAGDVAGTATSPALIARTLEESLAERGWFSHGLVDAGQPPSLSGHGADRITTLLTGDLMVGDGEQYATAMALMAREMGLPARVVMGFLPEEDGAGGAGEGDDGAGVLDEVTITGGDVQAWVEIAFAGHGWVPFHPTPDDSRVPSEETPTEQSDPEPQVVQPPPPPPEPVQPPPEDTDQARTEDTEEHRRPDDTWRQVLVAAAVAGVPILLVVGPLLLIALAKRRRRRRRRTDPDGVRSVVGGWDEVLDHARDLRRPAPAGATRREIAVRLVRAFAPAGAAGPTRRDGAVSAAVAALATGADAVVFGPDEPDREAVDAYWAQVDVALAAMHRAVPGTRRWRARWSTASLRARRRERRLERRERRRTVRSSGRAGGTGAARTGAARTGGRRGRSRRS